MELWGDERTTYVSILTVAVKIVNIGWSAGG